MTVTQNLTFKYPWLDKHTRSHFMEDFTLSFLSGKEKNTIIDHHYCYYCYISFACELLLIIPKLKREEREGGKSDQETNEKRKEKTEAGRN